MARRRSCNSCNGVCTLVTLAALVMLQLFAVALHPNTGPWLLTMLGVGVGRRLQRYANVVPYDAAGANTGCVEVWIDAFSKTFDLSTKACNGFACPPCFHIIAASNDANKLTLASCSTMMMGNYARMGQAEFANAVQVTTIINVDNNKEAVVVDGQGTETRLRKGSVAIAACSATSNNRLQFASASATSLRRFIAGPFGTESCPVGSSKVTTPEMCVLAASMVLSNSPDENSWATVPTGCGVHKDGEIHFNTAPTGAISADHAVICILD